MNIVLTGFMGTGKTAVGEKLAKELKMQYVDTDKMIEEDTGTTISKIFKKFGEDHFRELETQAVKCVAMLDNFVIATGGGAVLRKENMEELERNGVVICLSATPEVIYRRTGENKKRQLLAEARDAKKKIKEMLAYREPFYRRADFTIDTSDLNTGAIVTMIIDFVKKYQGRGKK